MRRLDLLSLVFIFMLAYAHATLVNITIDDTFGDERTSNQVVYTPPAAWNANFGQDCTSCATKPDLSRLLNATWHEGVRSADQESDGTTNQQLAATVTFEGVAVYVYCIIAHSSQDHARTSMRFFLDNTLVGTYVRTSRRDTAYEYNVPVYVNRSLSPGQHTISIVNGELSGGQSPVLLDYIVYTQDMTTTHSTSFSLSPSQDIPASALSASRFATHLLVARSSQLSHTHTIVIAVVVSIVGLLVIMAIIGFIICFRRRHYNTYNAPADGVIAPDATNIDEEDPETSGWVEGTWTGDDDSTHRSSGRRTNSNKRKRGPSNSRSPLPLVPSLPATPSSGLPPVKVKGPTVPAATVAGVQAIRISPSKMSSGRADPTPLSPTSSFGNLTSTVPDSATYLISPPASSTNFPNRYPDSTDTFLDMGRSFTDPDAPGLTTLSAHNAHPFATAQAVAPSSFARQRSGRERSDSNQSTSSQAAVPAPPPSSSTGALVAASQRGRAARGPSKKPSGSDLASEASSNTHALPSASVASSSSPTPAPTPTSTTALVSKREPGKEGVGVSQFQSQSQARSQRPHAYARGAAPARRVDPIDPAMQPPRDGGQAERERAQRAERQRSERERSAGRQERDRAQQRAQSPPQVQVHSPEQHDQNKSRGASRRQGVVVSEQDRQQFGFLDVPVDAESRPPSYRVA